MSGLLGDVRLALRGFARSPAVMAAAVLSLGLGIGVNTAVFSLADQVLLRSLPVPHPEQLVLLRHTGDDRGGLSSRDITSLYYSYPMYRDLRDRNTVLSGLAATSYSEFAVSSNDAAETAQGEVVSGNYFDVLGIRAAAGRLLVPADDGNPGEHPVAVLSYPYWQRRFGGSWSVLNSSIRINGHPFTIVGVTASNFRSAVFTDAPDLFVPMAMKKEATTTGGLDDRRFRWLEMIGRLKPEVPRVNAEAAMNVLWHSLRASELAQMTDVTPRFRQAFLDNSKLLLDDGARGFNPLRKQALTPLLALLCMVAAVLIIACVNVANLLLARIASRQKETAVRLAMGGSRWRIARQYLAESLMLSAAGAALAIAIAPAAVDVLIASFPARSHLGEIFSGALDWRMLLFTFAIAAITALLVAAAPALRAGRSELGVALRSQGTGVVGGGRARMRRVLVVAQLALGLTLLVAASLASHSLINLKSTALGYRTAQMVTFHINPRKAGYSGPRIFAFYDRLREGLSAIPGTRGVTCSALGLLQFDHMQDQMRIAGYQPKEGEDMQSDVDAVCPHFLGVMDVPLIAGRDFTEQDSAGVPKVTIVSERFSRRFFGTPAGALGHWMYWGSEKPDMRIIGVAGDAKYASVRENSPPMLYLPYLQRSGPPAMTFYVRTDAYARNAFSAIRGLARQLDPNVPVDNLAMMDDAVNDNLFAERIVTMLAGTFALLAAALAAVGLYGVISYGVSRRTREIGVRMAMGASRAGVLRLVLSDIGMLVAGGVLAAAPLILIASRLIRTQLYGVGTFDVASMLAAAFALAMSIALAVLTPALRATRIDPAAALRDE